MNCKHAKAHDEVTIGIKIKQNLSVQTNENYYAFDVSLKNNYFKYEAYPLRKSLMPLIEMYTVDYTNMEELNNFVEDDTLTTHFTCRITIYFIVYTP